MKKNFNQCLSFQFQCNFFPRAMLVSFTSYVIAFNFRKLINNALNLCKLPLQMYNKLISRQFCCCTTICTQHSSRSSDKIACVNNLTETPKVFAMLNLKELPLYSNNNKTVTGEFIIDFYWISMYNCFALIVCVWCRICWLYWKFSRLCKMLLVGCISLALHLNRSRCVLP